MLGIIAKLLYGMMLDINISIFNELNYGGKLWEVFLVDDIVFLWGNKNNIFISIGDI